MQPLPGNGDRSDISGACVTAPDASSVQVADNVLHCAKSAADLISDRGNTRSVLIQPGDGLALVGSQGDAVIAAAAVAHLNLRTGLDSLASNEKQPTESSLCTVSISR